MLGWTLAASTGRPAGADNRPSGRGGSRSAAGQWDESHQQQQPTHVALRWNNVAQGAADGARNSLRAVLKVLFLTRLELTKKNN